MSEENNEMATVDETPKPEETESTENKENIPPEPNEETKPETKKPTRVKITEVAKQKTECKDCHKTVSMKTLRYSHPEKCEGKPCDIMTKPVRKNNVKPRVKAMPINTQTIEEVEQHEEPPKVSKAPPPVSKSMPPPPPPFMNPYDNLSQAQLIQLQMKTMNQELLRRRQEKADALAKAMFQSKTKNLGNNIYKYGSLQ